MKADRPLRTCLGCGKKREKSELARLCVVGGFIEMDSRQVLAGRGCYVCRDAGCAAKMIKSKKVFNALKIKRDDELLRKLTQEIRDKIKNSGSTE